MSFNAPKAPDPVATSNAQQQYNLTAATNQNKINSYDQSNPYSSVNYVADPSSPSGYRIEQSLNPTQQGLLNTYTGNQGKLGQTAQDIFGTAGNLAKNSASMYSTPFDLNSASGAVASRLNDWNARYLHPIFDQQSSNLEAQLRNQGLTPGSEAYNNAKNLLARNQGDVTTDYLTKNQGQAFNQALTEYGLPLQTLEGLTGVGGSMFSAAAPNAGTYQSPPQAQIQPPNYAGQVQQNYQNELQNYQNSWGNLGKLGTSLIGLGMAPMTGGGSIFGSLAGGLGSMFGGSSTGSPGYGNFGQYSPYSPMNS
jgi:hypothetical protein